MRLTKVWVERLHNGRGGLANLPSTRVECEKGLKADCFLCSSYLMLVKYKPLIPYCRVRTDQGLSLMDMDEATVTLTTSLAVPFLPNRSPGQPLGPCLPVSEAAWYNSGYIHHSVDHQVGMILVFQPSFPLPFLKGPIKSPELPWASVLNLVLLWNFPQGAVYRASGLLGL